MKKNYIHTTCILALVGMMAAGLWGCQKDDLAEQGGNAPQTELQLTVIDGGYTAHQALNYEDGTLHELPQTRATENGYKTIFAAGDQIGLYAVKGSSLVATNVCLKLTDENGTLKWKPTAAGAPAGADYYFAYYPYKSSPGTVTATATTADEFFAKVISAWTPATDQSGTNYTAQDLMVGMGTLGATPVDGFYPLTITLAHKMGLAVVKLPTDVTDINFYTYTPYAGVSGEYRYLLKPSTPTNLSCSFNDGGEVRGFVTAATVAGGNYKTYNVKGKPPVSMSFGIDLTSYTSDKTYMLPFKTTGVTGDYELTVDWGDGSQVTNIPAGTDLTATATTSLLTHTYAEAKAYTITISSSQTDFSKEQIPGFRPGNYRTSGSNKLKLKSVYAPLLNTGETDFTSCFYGCKNLTGSIPENLFINNPQVKILKNCFRGCSGLTGAIPENLFANNPLVTSFFYCFQYCSGLTGSIPEKLFINNPLVEDFNDCFAECSGLTGAIPEGLFAHNPEVTTFYYVFFNCRSLTSIPSKLFKNNTKAEDFEYAFGNCPSLSSIPSGLFDNNPAVTNFMGCFALDQIPSSNMFGSIPAKLFAKNLKATNFRQCFQGQTKLLLNSDIFCEETSENKANRFVGQTVDFSSCFDKVGSDSSVSGAAGTAPALWNGYAGTFTSTECFRDIGTVTNAGDILDTWK